MSTTKPFRFVHTSDLHLEQPLQGVGEIPEHLVDLFLDAPFRAAESVFDVAIHERVDAVVIAGDLLDWRAAGPRGLDFVLSQFRRLADQQIDVYWVSGQLERLGGWPLTVTLPANVHRFAEDHVDSVTIRVADKPIAVIQGRSANAADTFAISEFDSDATLPTIATVYGKTGESTFSDSDIAYWALGGEHQSGCMVGAEQAYYCGSPQGRRPSEPGPHGCALVEIDSQGHVERQFRTTDAARWYQGVLELPDILDRAGLLRWLRDRTHQWVTEADGRPLLLRWIMSDTDETSDTQSDLLAARLREGGLADELLESLRHEFGTDDPPVWHFELEVDPPRVLPSGWYEEDTVLGDLLRSVQRYQNDPLQSYPLETLPADACLPDRIIVAIKANCRDDRNLILRRVAALGVDLLRGDRVLSDEFESTPTRLSAGGGL